MGRKKDKERKKKAQQKQNKPANMYFIRLSVSVPRKGRLERKYVLMLF